jgi:glutathione synthase/RimK-type ligase-like ATP-grasp enzyme
VRIAFLLVRHPASRPSPIFPEVIRLLRARGADVGVIHPDEDATELRAVTLDRDLYVLKAGTEAALSLAGALHALGAAILNPYPVSAMCRDKIVASKVLDEAGVPAPRSYVASRPHDLVPLLDEGPLIVKPYRGSQGRGIRVVSRRSELIALDADGGPLFAQRYLEPDGLDRKIYCIGDEVFGVERTWPVRTYEEKLGRPFEVDREVREIALRCGSAFGLSVFGFDIVVSRDRPYVVDISSLPGFKGVPDAAERLADHFFSAGERVTNGEPLLAGLVGAEWVRV